MRICGDERGGASSFLLLIVPVLFVLFALFADLIRLRMATSEAESMARRMSRSALSAFEPALLQYGLFGTGGQEGRWDGMIGAVKQSEAEQRLPGRFALYDATVNIDNTALEPMYPLADHRVFRRQILERMKYIAGIEFGIEVAQQFARGKQQIAAAEQYAKLSGVLEQLVKQRESALDDIWELAEQLANSARSASAHDSLQQRVDDIVRRLNDVEGINANIAKELNGLHVGGDPPAEAPPPPVTIYPPTYFSAYKTGAATIGSMHSAWLKALIDVDDSGAAPHSSEVKEQLDKYAAAWISEKSKEELQRQQENETMAASETEQKQAAEQEMKQQRDRQDVCRPADADRYAELEGKGGWFDKYRTYNEHIASGGMDPLSGVQEAEPLLFASLELARTIVELAELVRDEVLVNEYALTHFTYRTYETDNMKYAANGHSGIGDRETHRLKGQEAEYILYGFPDCRLNLGAMHAELFVLRTGLRTVESLTKSKTAAAASPLLLLLNALAEGAKAANGDVEALLAGKAIDLPFLPGVVMDYKDHLRLFYLLHSHNESVLSRMQSLVQLNTGIDLMQYYSAVRIRMNSEPNGWLLRTSPVVVDIVTSY